MSKNTAVNTSVGTSTSTPLVLVSTTCKFPPLKVLDVADAARSPLDHENVTCPVLTGEANNPMIPMGKTNVLFNFT